MKGRTRTAEEVRLHDRIAELGCICCRIDGIYNPVVSIHHVNGRTAPFCHHDVLPLCGAHHQKLDPDTLAIHGDKRRWQAKYGNQYDLIQLIMAELGYPYICPKDREHLAPNPGSKPKNKAVKAYADPAGRKSPAARSALSRPKQVASKRQPTEEQLRFLAESKEQQKELQRQRKARYEAENKDKIEAQKASARQWAKAQRQEKAAERKENAKAAKRSRKAA